jgi:hypothetical protein
MNRETEAQLLAFCAAQREAFDAESWRRFPGESDVRAETLACAALFLGGVDWYGHVWQLPQVAEDLVPGIRKAYLKTADAEHFDFGRFSNRLRRELENASPSS